MLTIRARVTALIFCLVSNGSEADLTIDLLSCVLEDSSCVQTITKQPSTQAFIDRCQHQFKGSLQHKLCKMEQAVGKCKVNAGAFAEEYIHYRSPVLQEKTVRESCRLANGRFEPVSLEQQVLDETKIYYEQRFKTQTGTADFEKKASSLTQKILDSIKESQQEAQTSENWYEIFDKAKLEVYRQIWAPLMFLKGGGCGTLATFLCGQTLKTGIKVQEVHEEYSKKEGTTSEQHEQFFMKRGFCTLQSVLDPECSSYAGMKHLLDHGCAIEIIMYPEEGPGHVEFLHGVGKVELGTSNICWGVTNSWSKPGIITGGTGNFRHSEFEEFQGTKRVFSTTICPCTQEHLHLMKDQLIQSNKDPDVRAASTRSIAMSSVRMLSKIANAETLRKLVKDAGVDPDKISESDVYTALQLALRDDRTEDAKLLVAAGADPKQIKDARFNAEVFKAFILTGAKINWDNSNWEVLLNSIHETDIDVVRALIASGIDLNRMHIFRTLLRVAVEKHYTEIAEILLAAGANPDEHTKDSIMKPLIDIALQENQVGIFKALIVSGAKLTQKSKVGWTFIIDSITEKDLDVVKKLIADGSDPNSKNIWGETLISIAVKKNFVEIVKTLLAAGADPNVTDRYQDTLITVATRHNYHEIVKALLSSGANPNAKDRWGHALIHTAVTLGFVEIAEALLSRGADPNTLDNQGHPLLDGAVLQNRIGIAKALIAAGADLSRKDKFGFTIIERAELLERGEILKAIREAQAR